MDNLVVKLSKDQVLCAEGEKQTDLYFIKSGQLLVCLDKGGQITPIDYLGPGEFVGELSFFDEQSRSANLIAIEETVLFHFPTTKNLQGGLPSWPLVWGRTMVAKIRQYNKVIHDRGLKRTSQKSIQPLSISEQSHYFKILKEYRQNKL